MKLDDVPCVIQLFSLERADVAAGFDVAFVETAFRHELREQLEKKGLLVKGVGSTINREIAVQGRFVKIHEGDSSRRRWLLFGGECEVELEGEVALPDASSIPFHVKCAQGEGFLGGDSKELLGFCARICAAKAAKEVIRGVKTVKE